MITHDLIQGTPEWDQFRLEHFGASECAPMLGLSKKTTRTELLHMKKTGSAKEFSDWVQKNILNYGHEVEALARPIIEEMFGIDLYPVTCSDGRLSASCDGLTLCETIAFEHKQWNQNLAAAVSRGELPDEYMPQCQQIMMVTGAEKVIFTVSDGTRENMVWMEIEPSQEWFFRISVGWDQFYTDLEGYVPFEIAEPAKAAAPKDLPVVTIQVRGELTMSNLGDVTPHFDRFLSQARTDLKTDDDFAVAEAESKLGRETAKRCKLTAKAVVDQILPVSEVVRTLEEYAAKFDALALKQEKAVKEQKDAIKSAILSDARLKFAAHITALEAEIKPIRLGYAQPDFQGAIKSKRTLASLHDAVETALANGKINADAIAKDARAKLVWHKENAKGYEFLFSDLQSIIQKRADDFQMLVQNRIGQHKMDEARKLEAERARIQAEEQKKVEERAIIARAEENAKIQAKAFAEQAAAQSTPATIETPKPILVKTEAKPDAISPALRSLARHYASDFRKKYAPIPELSAVMREIDLFLVATEKTA